MAKRPLLDNLIRRLSIDSGEKKRPAEDNEILLEREGPLFWGNFLADNLHGNVLCFSFCWVESLRLQVQGVSPTLPAAQRRQNLRRR